LKFIEHEYSQRHDSVSEDRLKAQIVDAIEHLYGRQDGTGYIFIYSFEGVNLSDPVQTQNIGKNLYNFKDQNGVQVVKELIDTSRKEHGG
jgi:signal transduction histidine kinase